MVYCETIEESKTWTCPKSGVWKVICVGGGGAGYFSAIVNSSEIINKGEAGTATSFGSLLVADGGENGEETATAGGFNALSEGNGSGSLNTAYGINGYNGVSCYGTAFASTIGCGYGASGGAGTKYFSNKSKSSAGMPGKVLSKILDISEGEVIACTIGKGGTVSKASDTNYGWALPGRDGAIIVQYLGDNI